MKKLLFIGLILTALVTMYTVAAMAADAPKGAVEIKFVGDAAAAKYAPVKFEHAKHAAQKCEDCHHKMAESKDMACTKCHKNVADKKATDSFDAAFHDRKSAHSCVGCHTATQKGPTKCNDCHTKK